MKNTNRTWFLRGFGVTMLGIIVVLTAIMPAIGSAQGGIGNLDALLQTDDNAETTVRFTDDPQGRIRIPVEDTEAPQDNLQVIERSLATENEVANPLTGAEAQALEAAIINAPQAYSSPLIIPAADFGADGANPDSFFFPFGGGYMQGDSENYGCLVAPAYLPNGVTVEEMFVTVYDDDTTYNLYVDLRRVDNFTGDATTMASANTSGEFTGIQVISDASIVEPVVVYPDYAYYVTTCVQSSNIRLYSARLYYTTP